MLSKYLPFVLAGVLIGGLTLVEARFSDRWHDSSVDAAEFGKRFAQVPMDIGSWHGEDLEVEEDVRNTAGAVNYVSRRYTEASTGSVVTLWLIVGHSRNVCRHTPNICYPNAGFTQESSILKFHLPLPDGKEAVFNTAKFEKADELSRHVERVFWSWNHPDRDRWEAPNSPRRTYGNSRALYKIYFTSSVLKGEETIEESVAVKFAKQMLPLINAALFGDRSLESPVEATGQRSLARSPGSETWGPESGVGSPETTESLGSPELAAENPETGGLGAGNLESTESLELGSPGSKDSLESSAGEGKPETGEPATGEPATGEPATGETGDRGNRRQGKPATGETN